MIRADRTLRSLIEFGAEAVEALEQQGVHPIVYGSLAYMAHTNDPTQGVHDIDFLIPAADRQRIDQLLSSLLDIRIEPTSYHSTKVHRGELVISFDEIERFPAVSPLPTVQMTVAGRTFAMVDRTSLEAAYEAGAATIPRKVDAYLAKLRRLRGPQ